MSLFCFARTVSLLAVILFLSPANEVQANTNDFFARGLELSRTGEFPEAAAAFASAANHQPATGTLANLGLAEWQSGHAGLAILAWEQACWIAPYDQRARVNLAFARQIAQVDPPQLNWYETVSTWLPPNTWVWVASGSLWLAVGLVLLPGIFRRRKAGWQQWLAALAFGVFLFSLAGNAGVTSRTHIGFVLKKNTPLRLTPTHEGETISTVSAGEPARKLRTRGDYVFVRTANGSGWLDQKEFGLICPP